MHSTVAKAASSGAGRKNKNHGAPPVTVDHSGLEKSIASIGTSVLDVAKLDCSMLKELLHMKLKHERESEAIHSLHADIESLCKEKCKLLDSLEDEEVTKAPRAKQTARLSHEIEDIETQVKDKVSLLNFLLGLHQQ